MTENKAKLLLCQMYLPQFDEEEKQALTVAIQALEEIQAYRAIGTVEQIRFMQSVCDMSDDMLKSIADAVRAKMKYEAIGTVEEFKDLKEKATPKKPNGISKVYGDYFGSCPICNRSAMSCLNIPYKYCPKCGQALDWSE